MNICKAHRNSGLKHSEQQKWDKFSHHVFSVGRLPLTMSVDLLLDRGQFVVVTAPGSLRHHFLAVNTTVWRGRECLLKHSPQSCNVHLILLFKILPFMICVYVCIFLYSPATHFDERWTSFCLGKYNYFWKLCGKLRTAGALTLLIYLVSRLESQLALTIGLDWLLVSLPPWHALSESRAYPEHSLAATYMPRP